MSELAEKIYIFFQSDHKYYLSPDPIIRSNELAAIAELENNFYIDVKMRTIGYICAKII